MSHKKILAGAGLVLSFWMFVSVANADHSWDGYHWARTANPFTLQLGDNVSSTWDSYLGTTASDWSLSAVLDTAVATGATKASNCKAINGRVEICSSRYGNTGWLGIAQIWISGLHIIKGTVKVNDTYFTTRTYNTPAWRNLVMCQEVGHMLGLSHQDEVFNNPNLGTCMDYTNNPSTNQAPNQHDYDELVSIYDGHTDNISTILTSSGGTGGNKKGKPEDVDQDDTNLDNPSAWGKAVRKDARGDNSVYVRDLGNGKKVFTFVTWVQ